eukprot:sb/3476392/
MIKNCPATCKKYQKDEGKTIDIHPGRNLLCSNLLLHAGRVSCSHNLASKKWTDEPPSFNVVSPVSLEECVDKLQDCPKWINECDPLHQNYQLMIKDCPATCKKYNNDGGMDTDEGTA